MTDRTGRISAGPYNPASKDRYWETSLDIAQETLGILDETLGLKGRTAEFALETPLLGAVPELDSMGVVALLTTIEERFGIAIADDEIDGGAFATVATLVDFIRSKLPNS